MAATPQTIGMGMSLVQGAIGGLRSIGLGKKARRIDTSFEPYKISQEYYDNRAAAQNLVNVGGMAGYGRAADQLDTGMASTMGQMQRAGGSAADLLAGATQAQTQRNQSSLALAGMAAQSQAGAMDRLADTKETIAGEEEKKWMYEEYFPAQERMREKRLLESASRESMDGALNSLTNAAGWAAAGGVGGGGASGGQAPATNPWGGQGIQQAGSAASNALLRTPISGGSDRTGGSADPYRQYGRSLGIPY